MKITQNNPTLRALHTTASGTTVIDAGGYFGGGPLTVEEILALIGAGASPTAFITVIGGGKGTTQDLSTLGATRTIDLGNANYFYGTLDQDCTIGFTGWTNGKDCQITVEVSEDGTGGWVPTFSGVSWIGGVTPIHDTTAGTVSLYIFLSRDGGTTIYGALAGSGLTQDIIDALTGANSPDSGNVFATMADLGGGSSSGVFKRTVLNGNGNMTISTGRDEIDATALGYLTLTLAVGDVVRCTIECQYYANSGTIAIYFDFEVDQPTSANTSIAVGQTGGLWETTNAGSRDAATPFGLFTATEAGVHGFRPMAWTSANTATIANAASGNDMTQVTFIVEKLGQPAA